MIRGRLPFVKPSHNHKCRSYDSILDPSLGNLMEKLETMPEDTKPEFEPKAKQRSRKWKEKLEEHKERIKEEYAKCMLAL